MDDNERGGVTVPIANEVKRTAARFASFVAEQEKGKVSLQEYTAAVVVLVGVAQQGTSGGRAAAQVLLSAYNGSEWQLDITDLNNLDRNNFEAAMTVIRGRHDTWTEPHSVIQNGSRIFDGLWKKWFRWHVAERGKIDCRFCDGRGLIFSSRDDESDEGTLCKHCQGSGRVCRCQK
uniref:DUF7673 domain-containing protein n=1 Tax=Geobacter sp. (strain M21) TaxID=443144 RepID=C6DZ80_GEOSM